MLCVNCVALDENYGPKYNPYMEIGMGTSIGYNSALCVCNKVIIGKMMIAGYTQINDTPITVMKM